MSPKSLLVALLFALFIWQPSFCQEEQFGIYFCRMTVHVKGDKMFRVNILLAYPNTDSL